MYRASSSIWSLVSARAVLAGVLGALVVSGCGFQLRGVGVTAHIEPMYVTALRDTATLDTLVRNFEQLGVIVLDEPAPDAWRLTLLEERAEDREAEPDEEPDQDAD
jgi:outer membrane lipopolysaccharide assembly protein LptE/RlpB